MNRCRLLDNWTNATRLHNEPNEKGDASDGSNDRLDREEVADDVQREVDGDERCETEQEESEEVPCVGPRVGNPILYASGRRPDGLKEEIYALPANPGLYSVPYARLPNREIRSRAGVCSTIAARLNVGQRPP